MNSEGSSAQANVRGNEDGRTNQHGLTLALPWSGVEVTVWYPNVIDRTGSDGDSREKTSEYY